MKRAAVLAVLLLPSAAIVETQNTVFSAKVEAVRVDVLVTDNGQPVLGLGAADFEVTDNGVPQKVDFVSYDQIPLNVILTLDMSDSVAGDRLDHLRSAGAALLAGLKNDDQAALVTFSHLVALGAGLTSDPARVRRAIDQAVGAGDTALLDGTYAAITLGESDPGRALVIVFSDGVDTSSWLTPEAVLEAAKRSDAVVYAVSTRSRLKPEFLRDVTSLTGGRLFEIEKTATLGQIFVSVLEEFRRSYLVSYTPKDVDKNGWHRLDVRVKGRRVNVRARPGYLAGNVPG
jgi:Ca-activated chloride channel family protein